MPEGGRVLALGTISSGVVGGLTDVAQNFTVNAWIGQVVHLHESGDVFSVVSNTATSITFAGSTTPEAGEAYTVRETVSVALPQTVTPSGAVGQITQLPLYIDPAPAPVVLVATVQA